MPLAAIWPRDLRALRVRLATRNIEFCSFGKLCVLRHSRRMSHCDGDRDTQYRSREDGRKFVRDHGSFPS
jgi:hypothetical protein